MSSWKKRLENSDNGYYSPKDIILGMEEILKIKHDLKKKILKASFLSPMRRYIKSFWNPLSRSSSNIASPLEMNEISFL